MTTTTTFKVDKSRGFDVFRGKKLMESFSTYEEAAEYAAKAHGRYVRYWAEVEKSK